MRLYPFKHLAAYQREDEPFYFGRKEEADKLYRMTFETDLILIYGQSGVGKSGLINCGLANKFKSYEWMEIAVRRGDNMNDSLAEILDKKIDEGKEKTTEPSDDKPDITEQIRMLCRRYFEPVYLIFDQFEELYISGNDKEQNLFYQNIKKILSLNQPIKIIISIREEYLGYLYEFEKEIPQLFSHKCWIKPLELGVDNQESVIDEILQGVIANKEKSNVWIENDDKTGLAEGIKELFKEKEKEKEKTIIDLPSLQILFHEFYIYRSKDNNFKSQEITIFSADKLTEFQEDKKITDVKDIVWEYLESLVDDFKRKKVKPETIWGFLRALVTDAGTKKNLAESDLRENSEFSESEIAQITKLFRTNEKKKGNNILNTITKNGETCWELRHDVLAKCISEKMDSELRLKKLIEVKMASESKDDFLTLFQLDEINKYEERLRLNKEQKEFVEKSRQKIEAEKKAEEEEKRAKELELKKKKRMLRVTRLLLVVAGIFLIFALWQWRETTKAKEETQEADARTRKAYDAFYFYDGKFALAYGPVGNFGSNWYYFIDKRNGDAVKKLDKWKKAEQFDEFTGFAKVIDDNEVVYLLDTLGNKYKYTNKIEELDNTIQALDLSKQELLELPKNITNYTNLKYLNLSFNLLKKLPAEIGELTNLTTLDLWSNQIIDITPLQELKLLTTLGLGENQISDITPLQELKNLTTLGLSSNQIIDITPLQELKLLTSLDLWSNQIIDITPLQELKLLTKLGLGENQIIDIKPLQELKLLTKLYLSNNQISDIKLLQDLKLLTELYLSDNQISDIKPLKELKKLTILDLQNNQISDIKPLKELKLLTELWLSNNQISDIKPLQELKLLTELGLSNNQISDIKPLQELKLLTELELSNNQISDIKPLQELKLLTELELSNNQISDIKPLQELKLLTTLWLSDNQISDIKPLQELKLLTILDLSDNKLTSLPSEIDNLTNLIIFDWSGNPLDKNSIKRAENLIERNKKNNSK